MTQALALAAFLFSFLSFVVSIGTLTYLLARRFSKVEHIPTPVGETQYQFNLPPTVSVGEDGTPVVNQRPPVTLSEAEYEKQKRLARLEAEFENAAADLDFE